MKQAVRLVAFTLFFAASVIGVLAFGNSSAEAVVNSPSAQVAQGAPPTPVVPNNGSLNVSNLEKLSNGLTFYALMACLAGILVSASLWAMGSQGANPGTELAGKRGMVLCCTAAFFIGAVPAWINSLDNMTKTPDLDPDGITQTNIPIVRN